MLMDFMWWYQKVFYGRNRKINIILLGPPCSGKTTQAALISEKYGNCYISTDDMLKSMAKSGTKLGNIIKDYMDKDEPVPDSVMMDLLDEKIRSDECAGGIIMDGFPKNLVQSKKLSRMMGEFRMPVTGVLDFRSDDETLEKRIVGRLVHEPSGRVYHETLLPPKIPMRDDLTGDPLVKLPEDNLANLKKRLQEYKEMLPPLARRYDEFRCRINATKPPDQVFQQIVKKIELRKQLPAYRV